MGRHSAPSRGPRLTGWREDRGAPVVGPRDGTGPGTAPGRPDHEDVWGPGDPAQAHTTRHLAAAYPAARRYPGSTGYTEGWGAGTAAVPHPRQPHPARVAGPRPEHPQSAQEAGPRPEYIALFDELERTGSPARPAEKRQEEKPSAPAVEPAGEGEAEGRGRRPQRGRTFTGVAAAAVTTVLAAVVAGQVAEGPQVQDEAAAGGDFVRDGSGASRSQPRAASKPDARRAPSLHEQLKAKFPLPANLALSGAFATVGGSDKAPGKGRVIRYRVDVEKGLPLDGELFARLVHETLNDPRGWGHDGSRTFERVSSGPADFVITLASPGTTDVWCAKSGLDTSIQHVSCDSASTERVMINAYRWAQGSKTFGDDMLGYRQMLINHEVGHRLGYGHATCAKDGAPAPVMMQQTKFLTTDGATCKPNPWVKP